MNIVIGDVHHLVVNKHLKLALRTIDPNENYRVAALNKLSKFIPGVAENLSLPMNLQAADNQPPPVVDYLLPNYSHL